MKKKRDIGLPEYIMGFAIFMVLFSFVAFYLIDIRNIFGSRDFLFSTSGSYFFFTYRPFFFEHWGRNSGFAEILQWSSLGFSALISAFIAGKLHLKNKGLFKFWLLMSFAFVLMLMEDAGDIRHSLMGYVQWMFDEPDQGVMGSLTELFFFSILGGIPLYALIRYWNDVKVFVKTKTYLLIGFFFYAAAGSMSFLGTALEGLLPVNLYTFLGRGFYDFALRLGGEELRETWTNWESSGWFRIEFSLMDSLIEENVELIGAGALLAATVSFLIYISKKKKIISPDQST